MLVAYQPSQRRLFLHSLQQQSIVTESHTAAHPPTCAPCQSCNTTKTPSSPGHDTDTRSLRVVDTGSVLVAWDGSEPFLRVLLQSRAFGVSFKTTTATCNARILSRSWNMRIHRLKDTSSEKKTASGMTNRVSASAVRRGRRLSGGRRRAEVLVKGLSGQRKENSACQSA